MTKDKKLIEMSGNIPKWEDDLAFSGKGEKPTVSRTYKNAEIIMQHDPALAGRFGLDEFAGIIQGQAPLPWNDRAEAEGRFEWSDADSAGLRMYFDKIYNFRSSKIIDDVFAGIVRLNKFNPVKDYIEGCKWDGVPRLDTLLIDYLGAEDNSYVRAVTRKAFTAAVARVISPGCKYDTMLTLCGPQGIGKSTLLFIMGGEWFNDSISSFEGKTAAELLRGSWIIEIAELSAFNKSERERVKQFFTTRFDRYRSAYAEHPQKYPRMCAFFGTTNTAEFLRDETGNRRFWVVDVGINTPTKNVWEDLPKERDKLWAEAHDRYIRKEGLYLTGEDKLIAEYIQEQHREASAHEGIIHDFVNKPIPEDWNSRSIEARRAFWFRGGKGADGEKLVERDRICAVEVWRECFDKEISGMTKRDTREINNILSRLPGWNRTQGVYRFGPYGHQRGFFKE